MTFQSVQLNSVMRKIAKTAKKGNRSQILKFRLNEEEYRLFQKKASRYQNMSSMIRDAVKQFNDKKAKCWIETTADILTHLEKDESLHGKLGGNVNQIAHRANELACQGRLSERFLHEEVMPVCDWIINHIRETKLELDDIYGKLLKM